MENDIYKLELHETMSFLNGLLKHVIRVPGGWIYCIRNSYNGTEDVVFVPLRTERASHIQNVTHSAFRICEHCNKEYNLV